jgi:apolipoprotein N-acyltransferase
MKRSAVALIALSVGLHTLCLPPWNVWPLAWVALVPFFLALRGARPARGALLGLLWGTLAIWGIGYWVPAALSFYYQQPAWFGALFALGASIVFAGSYYAGFAACACWTAGRTRGATRAFFLSALWVAWELARARLLSGDPWLLLGYALMPAKTLIQAADVGGVFLLSFAVAFVNAVLSEALADRTRTAAARLRRLAPALAMLAALAAYGLVRLSSPLPAAPAVAVAVVQGNNDLGAQWREEFYGEGLEKYLTMSLESARDAKTDLLVWPESAVNFFLAHEPLYQKPIARMLAAVDADLIVGAPHYEGSDPARLMFFNSAFYVGRDGRIGDRYDKVHLLPFAEYFPLRTIDLLRRRFERVRFFTPGEGGRLLETRIGPVATVICFEGIFPDLVRRQMARGAVLLVNLSNDAWLGHGAGPEQHLQMVALRAVENRTWVIRSTTTGISAVVDPYGRIVARTQSFESAVLRASVAPLAVDTVYERYGDWFAYACLVAAAMSVALAVRRRA